MLFGMIQMLHFKEDRSYKKCPTRRWTQRLPASRLLLPRFARGRSRATGIRESPWTCVPGMTHHLRGGSPLRTCQEEALAKDKGVVVRRGLKEVWSKLRT